MTRANYVYKFIGKVVVIDDLNDGGMSVTNDIENVIDEICIKENINDLNFVWIYKDNTGNYDG